MDITLHPFIYSIIKQGVPFSTIQLLLVLPIVVTLVAFFRQVIGIKAFGIYTPSLITFSFLVIGLKYGVAIYLAVIFVGMLSRVILKKIRILYLSRVALTLTIISFAILALLVLGASIQRTGFASVSIVPIIIMIALAEKFIVTQIEKDTKTALMTAAQTLLISLVAFYIAGLPVLNIAILAHPWIPLLTIPVNLLLGKWTGLRLSEYYRFQSILKKH